MHTRAAVKRETALLQEAIQASETLALPLLSLAETETSGGSVTQLGSARIVIGSEKVKTKIIDSVNSKRKRASAKIKNTLASVKIELDVLPHGLGKRGDLLDDSSVKDQNLRELSVSQVTKSIGKRAELDDDRRPRENQIPSVGFEEQVKIKHHPTQIAGSGSGLRPATVKLRRRERQTNSAKSEAEDITAADDENIDNGPKKKRALSKQKGVPGFTLGKVNALVNQRKVPPKERPKKANKYGLTPGDTPFPNHSKPTPDDCEEVNRLLSTLHGEVKPPDVIPPPSMEVTGCGEVPDLLDAILRTLLSASTSANNSNLSLQGLKEKFHLRESGIGKGSVNWEAVHKATLDEVINAIKSGGLARVKGTNIKKILDVVYNQNCARLDSLLEEKENGKASDIPGAKNMTKEQKDAEISRVKENMLSMDHVFEMTTDEAMDEMIKLPGIGVKTASCVILFCMKRPSFAVDTHVWRHCKWLGWVPETATRDQTFSHCEVRVPDHLKYSLHQLFLKHGKTCGRCRANTSAGTEEWDSSDCPIDHLVNRTGKRKLQGNSSAENANASNTRKKSKLNDGEADESDNDGFNEEGSVGGSEYCD